MSTIKFVDTILQDPAANINMTLLDAYITPFAFEGRRRWRRTEKWMNELKKNVDSLIVIPNERLLSLLDVDCSMANVFTFSNDFVMKVVASCAENINVRTHVNLEFEDRTLATLWDRRIS